MFWGQDYMINDVNAPRTEGWRREAESQRAFTKYT